MVSSIHSERSRTFNNKTLLCCRSELKLETLEDAVLLKDPEDDILQDKRGCPAYVSPEILRSHARYSGRAADMWSLGVILYTMLVGRYPFNDSEHASLFAKISRGHFVVPECLSSRAKCLIRSLLRRDPCERLTADDVLLHPWLTREERYSPPAHHQDQLVPDCVPL
ncbi:Tribbles 2 [Homalodisca vitripennis]|nr:Tribbles 2 [Homalodisca vitripennis]